MGTTNHTWLAFSSGKPPSFRVEAWHPFDVDWELSSLHKRLKELKHVKLVLGKRPGAQSASHPEMLFDKLPLPLLSRDSYVAENFGPFLEGFALTALKTGIVSGGRYVKWGNSLLPVPTPQVMYLDATEIPQDRHLAVINGHFCVTKSLVSRYEFYFRCIEFKPLSEAILKPRPKSIDYSHLFVPRPKVTKVETQRRFNKWLDGALSRPIQSSVIAFCFNLSEPWCIECVGSDKYSDSDNDWACNESFRPEVQPLALPEFDGRTTWKAVLNTVKGLITAYLDRASSGSAVLRRAKAVAVGFVDGDLHRVWPTRIDADSVAAPDCGDE